MTSTNNSVNNDTKDKNNVRVRTTVVGLILLTIGLMIIFKNNSSNLKDLPDDLISFYAKNLKPLFYQTSITEEDIFNFALYQNIPIDKQNNKLLQIGLNDSEEVELNVKDALINGNTNNYNKFVRELDLSTIQKKSLDSILSSYKNDIYKTVLVNENNAVAVDPKIVVLREALVYDINNFIKQQDLRQHSEILTQKTEPNANKVFTKVKADINSGKDRNFIFFTPDTVLNLECYVPSNNLTLNNKKNSNVKVRIENNDVKTEGKMYEIKDDKIIIRGNNLNEIIAKVKLPVLKDVIVLPPTNILPPKNKVKINKSTTVNIPNPPENPGPSFTFNYDDIGDLVEGSINIISDENAKNWVQFGLKTDSLGNRISFNFQSDSTFDVKKLKEELEKAKIELKKYKKLKKQP